MEQRDHAAIAILAVTEVRNFPPKLAEQHGKEEPGGEDHGQG